MTTDLTVPLDAMPKAVFSDDGVYRFLLLRYLGDMFDFYEKCNKSDVILFLMLNPSTADATRDDATIRRVKYYSKSWGYTWAFVCNLSPFRATQSQDLKKRGAEPPDVWERNMETIMAIANRSDRVVAAYGASGTWEGRADRVLAALQQEGHSIYALTITKNGHPHHPLYLPDELDMVPFPDGVVANDDNANGDSPV